MTLVNAIVRGPVGTVFLQPLPYIGIIDNIFLENLLGNIFSCNV